jgi:predicted nucleotidyltransferase
MHVLLKSIVGSKLHRLDTPDSDTDMKGVYVAPLKSLTDPFSNDERVYDASDKDETLYEFRHFARLATKGNPTVLEVLWSDMNWVPRESWDAAQELLANRQRFLDGPTIRAAHLGYAKSQQQKLTRDGYSENPRRAAKATVAWIRVLQQGIDLLATGSFYPNLRDAQPVLHDYLHGLKFGEIPAERGRGFAEELEKDLLDMAVPEDMVPDYDWIRDFSHRLYTGGQPVA